MSLTRIWTPSGNYSGGGTKRLIVLHTMEGFTGNNGAYDCAKYFQTDCGASSQVCIDNNRGKIWECVNRANGAWTQCNYNSVSVSAEQCGYASWTRDYWLSNRENELRNTADWIAEEAKKFGIPIRALSAGEAQGGGKGICQHMNLGSSGCGHSDCGPNYPIDKVIEWAGGSVSTAPPTQPPASGTAPAFPYPSTHYLGQPSSASECHSGYYGEPDHSNVAKWQNQMAHRGWSISGDGYYGPTSESVCRQFQTEKGLVSDGLCGPQTWEKSWTAPIT
jgi:peptidoglycan hydrolase-like protein with peptidoglycan-binding domain